MFDGREDSALRKVVIGSPHIKNVYESFLDVIPSLYTNFRFHFRVSKRGVTVRPHRGVLSCFLCKSRRHEYSSSVPSFNMCHGFTIVKNSGRLTIKGLKVLHVRVPCRRFCCTGEGFSVTSGFHILIIMEVKTFDVLEFNCSISKLEVSRRWLNSHGYFGVLLCNAQFQRWSFKVLSWRLTHILGNSKTCVVRLRLEDGCGNSLETTLRSFLRCSLAELSSNFTDSLEGRRERSTHVAHCSPTRSHSTSNDVGHGSLCVSSFVTSFLQLVRGHRDQLVECFVLWRQEAYNFSHKCYVILRAYSTTSRHTKMWTSDYLF